jgi:hypothetical protein
MKRYRVIGLDGREYGPVNAEWVREWLREGRLHSRTLICAEGQQDWRELGTVAGLGSAGQPATPSAVGMGAAPVAYQETNSWAVAGFVLGLLSFLCGFCCCCCIPLGPLGILCSVIGIVQIQRNPATQTGMGFAITGLVLSLFGLVASLILSGFSVATGGVEELIRKLEREFRYLGSLIGLG